MKIRKIDRKTGKVLEVNGIAVEDDIFNKPKYSYGLNIDTGSYKLECSVSFFYSAGLPKIFDVSDFIIDLTTSEVITDMKSPGNIGITFPALADVYRIIDPVTGPELLKILYNRGHITP